MCVGYDRPTSQREFVDAQEKMRLLQEKRAAARAGKAGPDGKPLAYGKRAFLNRGFVATAGWKAPAIAPFLQPFSGGGELPQGL